MADFQARLPSVAANLSTRLSRLAPLTAAEIERLDEAERRQRRAPARRELIGEGTPVRETRAVVSGWACRQRILMDGQRQVLSFLLPGDLIGMYQHRNPLAPSAIFTVSEVFTCPTPDAEPSSALAEAYARSAALDELHLLAQISRLGRMDAYQRLVDWLLETRGRLALAGLSAGDQFALPITQELLADALGLTSVYLNRTLQALRRDGLLHLRSGVVSLVDRARMEKLVDYRPARISADD